MALELSTAARNAACDAIVDLLDGGTIELRDAAQPASPNDADAGNAVATLTFGTPAFGAASAGSASANAITSDTNTGAGTVQHARLKQSGGGVICDMDIGEGSGTLDFDETTFASGGTASISSLSITVPES